MTPKRFFYVLCGLLVVILMAGGTGYYLASSWLSTGTKTLSQRLGDEEVADQQLSNLQDASKEYTQLAPLLPLINAALPQQKDQSTIALQLHNIAASSGMALDNLTFPATTTPGPTSQTIPAGSALAIPITFQLTGTYPQLQAFLQRQENLNRYTSVTSLDISTSSTGQLGFTITLDAFVKP